MDMKPELSLRANNYLDSPTHKVYNLCKKEFDNFKKLHDMEIIRIKNSNNKLISSMGI